MTKLFTKSLTILLCIASVGYAQKDSKGSVAPDRGRLTVTVNGPKGVVIKNPTVFIKYFHIDSLYADTIVNGKFTFKELFPGNYYISARADNFEQVVDTVHIEVGVQNLKTMTLKNRLLSLSELVVKGKIPMVSYKGDTIQFNPAGVHVTEGDQARQILEQMPGVDVKAQSITVHGNEIERTYVDGRSLFGDNPTMALDHVGATDVVKIQAYEETRKVKKGRRLDDGAQKSWVLNIVTKSKMINSVDAQMIASAGASLGDGGVSRHRLRGALGGLFNFFSDSLLVTVNLMHNNLDLATNNNRLFFRLNHVYPSYVEGTVAGFDVKRDWRKRSNGLTHWEVNYQFTRKRTESERDTRRSYFSTSDYDWRESVIRSLGTSLDLKHQIGTGITIESERLGTLKASVRQQFQGNHANNSSLTDDRSSLVSFVSDMVSGRRSTANETGVDLNYGLKGKSWDLSTDVRFQRGNNDVKSYRNNELLYDDESLNTIDRLQIPGSQHNTVWKAQPVWNYYYREGGRDLRLTADYTWETRNEKIQQVAKDVLTGEIDQLNTYGFSQRVTTNTPAVSVACDFGQIYKIGIDTKWENKHINDTHEGVGKAGYSFSSVYAKLHASARTKKFGEITMGLSRSMEIPNIAQLRQTVDNGQLYSVVTGNPSLKAAHRYEVELSYNLRLGMTGGVLVFKGQLASIQGYIGNAIRYFGEETLLPTYGYTAAKGSVLSTFENLSGAWASTANVMLQYPVAALKGMLSLSGNNTYNRVPSLYNSKRELTDQNTLGVRIALSTSKLSNTRLTFSEYFSNSTASSTSDQLNSRTVLLGSQLEVARTNIFKHGFLNLLYKFQWQENRSLHDFERDNVFNIHAGVKLLKGKAEISVLAFDVLNNYHDKRTSMFSHYTQWTETQNFGRYVVLNFVWNYRNLKTSRRDTGRGVAW